MLTASPLQGPILQPSMRIRFEFLIVMPLPLGLAISRPLIVRSDFPSMTSGSDFLRSALRESVVSAETGTMTTRRNHVHLRFFIASPFQCLVEVALYARLIVFHGTPRTDSGRGAILAFHPQGRTGPGQAAPRPSLQGRGDRPQARGETGEAGDPHGRCGGICLDRMFSFYRSLHDASASSSQAQSVDAHDEDQHR